DDTVLLTLFAATAKRAKKVVGQSDAGQETFSFFTSGRQAASPTARRQGNAAHLRIFSRRPRRARTPIPLRPLAGLSDTKQTPLGHPRSPRPFAMFRPVIQLNTKRNTTVSPGTSLLETPRPVDSPLTDLAPILFFDGTCALCNGLVNRLLRWDRRRVL